MGNEFLQMASKMQCRHFFFFFFSSVIFDFLSMLMVCGNFVNHFRHSKPLWHVIAWWSNEWATCSEIIMSCECFENDEALVHKSYTIIDNLCLKKHCVTVALKDNHRAENIFFVIKSNYPLLLPNIMSAVNKIADYFI